MSFSVLLSVYNKEKPAFFYEALLSIWDHQTLNPSQIVLVQDGPLTDELNTVICEWQHKLGNTLTTVPLEYNVGLAAALNEGLKYCQHELVARMDTDDVAMPTRFEKQIAFMQQNPEIAASSAQIEEWNTELTQKLDQRNLPTEPTAVARFAKRRSPLSHPVTIFRKSAVLAVGGYPLFRKAQDYALWSLLLSRNYQLANLPDILLKMRTGNEMLNRRGWDYFKQEYQLLKYQKKIGFLSTKDFLINTLLKATLRLSPNFIKKLAYKLARQNNQS